MSPIIGREITSRLIPAHRGQRETETFPARTCCLAFHWKHALQLQVREVSFLDSCILLGAHSIPSVTPSQKGQNNPTLSSIEYGSMLVSYNKSQNPVHLGKGYLGDGGSLVEEDHAW